MDLYNRKITNYPRSAVPTLINIISIILQEYILDRRLETMERLQECLYKHLCMGIVRIKKDTVEDGKKHSKHENTKFRTFYGLAQFLVQCNTCS